MVDEGRRFMSTQNTGVQGGSSNERGGNSLAREATRPRRGASEEMKGVEGGSSNGRGGSRGAAAPRAKRADQDAAHPLAMRTIRRIGLIGESEAAANSLAREATRRRRGASEEMKGVQGGSSNERGGSRGAAAPRAKRADQDAAHPLAMRTIRRIGLIGESEAAANSLAREATRRRRGASEEMKGVRGER